MDDQKQREEHILYVFNGLKNFIKNDRQKTFPNNDFIVGHTKHFIMDVLCYSNSPIFLNNPQGKYSVLFEAWRNMILRHLSELDQVTYEKCNGNTGGRLSDDIDLIKAM